MTSFAVAGSDISLNKFADVEQGFLPWLMEQVEEQLQCNDHGRMILDGLLREVVLMRTNLYTKRDEVVENPLLSSNTSLMQSNIETEEIAPGTTTEVWNCLFFYSMNSVYLQF